jgi:hypothetical protein
MSVRTKIFVTCVAFLLGVGAASAQFLHIGNPDLQLPDMTSGGKPTVMTIDGLTDIGDYAFDGSDLEIPFSLDGSGATVWLIIYTNGFSAPLTIEGEGPGPYADPEHDTPGWHVYDGTDVLVFKSDGQRFEQGDNTIVWNGRDMDGNVVESGSYHLFLAAFDDEAVPHIVGVGARQFGGGATIYFNTDRGEFVNFTGEVNNMENDWISNLEGFDLVDGNSLVEACDGREGCPGGLLSAVPLNDAGTEWIGNNRGGGFGWLARYNYDWDTRQIVVDESWGIDAGAENGILSLGDRLPGRQYHIAAGPNKEVVYATAGVSGTVSKIVGYDIETGAVVPGKDWDLSDLFMYDNNGADRSGGPGTLARFPNGEPDPSGLTLSGHHTSVTARLDFDGNIMYMNRNGDGFGDSKVFAEGAFGDFAYGHTEAPAFKYSIYSTKWGWVTNIEAGTNNTRNGFMLGEDGSGLFHFEPKQIPLTWPQYNVVIDDDSDWDGVYMSIGGFGVEAAANDFVPQPEEGLAILARYPIAHLPYDQKRVNLGATPTAVEELASDTTPDNYTLGDAYPNPFNPETTINFSLPWSVPVSIKVHNDQGQLVRTLVQDTMGPGAFKVTWDGRDDNGKQLASGVYLYQIQAPNLRMNKKITFLK